MKKHQALSDAMVLIGLFFILMIAVVIAYDLNIVKKRELQLLSPNPILVYPEKGTHEMPIDSTPYQM